MQRYTCNLKGECVKNPLGRYQTPDCEQQCQSYNLDAEDLQLLYVTLSYDPERALFLAPAEVAEFVWRTYKIRVAEHDALALLKFILTEDYINLYHASLTYPSVDDYLDTLKLDTLDWYLINVGLIHRGRTGLDFNWRAVRLLILSLINAYGLEDGEVLTVIFKSIYAAMLKVTYDDTPDPTDEDFALLEEFVAAYTT